MIKCVACYCKTMDNASFCHKCGAATIDMRAYRAAKNMAKGKRKGRKVLARLSQKQTGRLRGLTKQAGSFLDDVPISTKTFPDRDTHKAAVKLVDVLLDVLEVMRPLAEESGDAEMLDIIEDVQQRVEQDISEDESEELDEPLEEMGDVDLDEDADMDVDLDDEYDQGREVEVDEGGY